MTRASRRWPASVALCVALGGCHGADTPRCPGRGCSDAGTDTGAGTDAAADTGSDTGSDAAADTGSDAAADTGSDAAADTGSDAATDAASDAAADTGSDAAADTGSDAAADAGFGPVVRAPSFPAQTGFVPPVPRPDQISSTFGERWKTSASRYDFHLGVDYYDALDTPVYAIGTGTVYGVYPVGSPQYPNGGNVLVIQHPLAAPVPFHGTTVNRVFAVYLHLNSFAVAANDMVSPGQVVGAMGMTGDAASIHLHFETRVGTVCSLPYQTANPGASCVTGFDPHVHPFLFVGGRNDDQIQGALTPAASVYTFRYTATRGDLDFDVLETNLGTLGWNERLGIDATSTATLDNFDYGWVHVVPAPFTSSSTELTIDFQFPTVPSYIEFRDIHGRGVRYAP